MKNIYLVLFAFAFIAFSCKQKPYSTTASGLKYKIYKSNGGEKAKLGDIITFNFAMYNSKDSLLSSSYKMGQPMTNRLYYQGFGSLAEGFLMLGKGDSAAFFRSADSVTKGRPDKALPAGTLVKYVFKMIDIKSGEQYNKEMKARQDSMAKAADVNKAAEPAQLEQYIKDKAPNAIKTDSGAYYVIEKEGNGPKPKVGDSVKVHYAGYLLDGKKFDDDRGQTFTFKLGVKAGQPGSVIEGWEEAFGLLKKGTKAKLIIPSRLAYGARAIPGRIPAYSTLVFEVELVDIVK